MVDPRVAGAGIAMAIGMMVLLPTFNALNNSYMTDVTPPPWMPTPDDLPDDFKPPEDWEPPEGWEPPPDMEPPPGWEPPPGYDGPIPPGGCPPPLVVQMDEMTESDDIGANWDGVIRPFEIPKYAVAVVANVTFRDWQAQRVFASLEDPNGNVTEDGADGDTGGLLVPPTRQPPAEFALSFVTDPEDLRTMPPAGKYTLTLGAEIALAGTYQIEVAYAVACGGLLE